MKTYVAMIIFAGFLAVVPARSENLYPSNLGDPGTTYGLAGEFSQLVTLLSDETLRDIMCRLSGGRFTPGSLSSALGMPEGQILRRINTLRGWGLVRLARHNSATTIAEPLPGAGEQKLRRWADKYCGVGESCGKPFANPMAERYREREKQSGDEKTGPGGGGFEFKKKARQMRLKIGGEALLVELYNTPTADAIYSGAPFRSRVRISGGRIYFSTPIQADEEEDATYEMKISDLAYSPKQRTIAIGIEPSQFSHGDKLQFSSRNKISLATKSNIWGRAISDVRNFGAVAYGEEVSLERAD